MFVIVPVLALTALEPPPPDEAAVRARRAIVSGATPASTPSRTPFLAFGQPVRALAASDAVVVAVADTGEVMVFDVEGRVRRRIWAGAGIAGRRWVRPAAGRDGFAVGAGVAADDDFNDPYDVDSEIEDPENVLLDDDVTRRRGARAEVSDASPTVVAAGGSRVWTAGPGGLWRFDHAADGPPSDGDGDGDGDGGRPEQMGAPAGGAWRGLAASADGRWLVGARDGWLIRSDDGGESFAPIAPLGGVPARLAITDDGTVLLVDGQGLAVSVAAARRTDGGPRTGMGQEVVSTLPGGATDVGACGHRGLVLVAGRTLVIGPGGTGVPGADDGEANVVERFGEAAPEEADRIACAAGGANGAIGDRIAVYGARLWTRAEGHPGWSRRDDLPPLPVAAAVVAGDSVWVATAAGLWVLPAVAPVAPARTTAEQDVPGPPPGLPPPLALRALAPRREAGWWADVMPRIDLGFAAAPNSQRREVRAYFLLTFVLDGERGRTRERRRFALETARWRRASASAIVSLPPAAWPSRDPVDAEESAALAHVLETSP